MNVYRKIIKQIKKHDLIVIARHIGADPDALGSQLALKEIILDTFPHKKVYAVGNPANKFKYIGSLDKFDEEMYDNSLLIVLDTPDKKRVDGVDPDRFSYKIKIDHHPFVDKFCDIELIEEEASSACQMIIELALTKNLKITKSSASKLYIGLVSDTNRFLFNYTSSKTFDLVAKLIKKTNFDFTSLYEEMYLRPIKEIKFQCLITENLTITENGFAYIVLPNELLVKYEMDSSTAGNMVNNFNYIEEIVAWAFFSEDVSNGVIKGSIRSRGPVINRIASNYNGGGHIYASGVRLKSFDEIKPLIEDLDEACKNYKTKSL